MIIQSARRLILGQELRLAVSAATGKIAEDITNEYNRQMPVEATQERYDAITEHCRRDIPVPDAVAQALKETYPGRPGISAAPVAPLSESEQRVLPKF